MSRRVGLAVRLALSLGLVALILWHVGAPELRDALAAASLGGFGLVVLLHTGDRLLMAYKWRRLLLAKGLDPGLGEVFRAYYVSSFAGIFLPMTVGADLVRVAALRGGPVSSSSLIASIAVERALGALSQALFCGLSLLLIVGMQLRVEVPVAALGAAVVAMIALLSVSMPLSFTLAERVGRRLAARAGTIAKLGALAREYAAWRRHRRAMWEFLSLTVLEGLFPILTYAAAARALGIRAGILEMAALVPLVYLVARMPVAVAGIGPEQGSFIVAAGALLGLSGTAAAAVSFVVWPRALLVALLPGAVAYLLMRRRGALVARPRDDSASG